MVIKLLGFRFKEYVSLKGMVIILFLVNSVFFSRMIFFICLFFLMVICFKNCFFFSFLIIGVKVFELKKVFCLILVSVILFCLYKVNKIINCG